MHQVRLTVLLLICLSNTHSARAQELSIEKKLDVISTSIQQAMKANDIPAVSAAVLWEGKVHFINQGHMRRGSGQQVTENSLYQLASLSKTFVGIVTHRLLLDGTLRLDEPITKHLTGLSKTAKQKLQVVTVAQLLQHTSGLPRDSMSQANNDVVSVDYDTSDLLKELEAIRLLERPGQSFRYSNFGYALLAHVCEQAAEVPYPELLQRHVNDAYGLSDTTFDLNTNQSQRRVTAYHNVNRKRAVPPVSMGKLGPPTTMYSSVADLTKLMQLQLREYAAFADQAKATPLVLTKPQAPGTTGASYGYGFFNWGNGTLGHGGGMDGFGSEYHICPTGNFGVVLLTSSCGLWTQRLSTRMNAILRDDFEKEWTPFDPAERITQIFEQQGQNAALRLYNELRAAKPSPLDVNTRLQLAQAAKRIGNPQLLRMILLHAKEDFPQSEEIAAAWKRLLPNPKQ